MHLIRLLVRHFRNYEEALFECSPSVNVLYGANAQGKTNFLEAIHVLMIGRSFRTIQSSELIRQGSDGFYLEADFIRHGIEQKLKLSYNGKERRIVYNSTECPSLASLLGLLPGIVMTPDDELVKGPPQSRRLFLDLQIAQVDPLYVHYLSRYNGAMRQRNQLLRLGDFSTIESWEREMAAAAAYVTHKRHDTVIALQEICQRLSPLLSGASEEFQVHYLSKAPNCSNLEEIHQFYVKQFEKSREKEAAVGSTLYGPHRDELELLIAGNEVRSFGSEGQKRTSVAILRLAAWELLKQRVEEPPLMLVDDIGISLDDKRRSHLMDYLSQLGQVFLSSAQPPSALRGTACRPRFFCIERGKIQAIHDSSDISTSSLSLA